MFYRYFGLTRFYEFNSVDPREFDWIPMEWASYVNPLALLWLYYVLVVEARFLLKPQVVIKVSYAFVFWVCVTKLLTI